MNDINELIAAVRENVSKGLVFDSSFSQDRAAAPWTERGTLFAGIRSPTDAYPMIDDGRLLLVHQVPLDLGGADTDANLVCIPAYAAEAYRFALAGVAYLYDEGLFDTVRAKAGYHEGSVVAESLHWSATHSARAGGYEPSIIHLW